MIDDKIRATILLGGTVSLLVLWILLRTQSKATRDLKLPPIVTSHSGLDFVIQFLSPQGPQFILNIARAIAAPAFQLPEIRLLPTPFSVYIINDFQLARSILENTNVTKPYPFYEFFELVSRHDCFFSRNGPRAFHVRKAIGPCFSQKFVQRMTEKIEKNLEDWIEEKLKEETIIDMGAEMIGVTVDIISEAGFDYKLSKREKKDMIDDLGLTLDEWFLVLNPLRKMKATGWMFSDVRKAHRATNRMVQLCYKMLKNYREKDPKTRIETTIIAAIAENPNYDSDRQRASDMMAFFFAGFDTTASALGFTFLELARHPQEQIKLREALAACSGKNEQNKCLALKNVTREILRLYPPAALGSSRQIPTDWSIPGDESLIIPAGSVCSIPYYVVQRNGDVFDNPDEFVPSRWEDVTKDSPQLAALMPFGLGRRNCIGMSLAQAELSTVIARLFSGFEFSVAEEGHIMYRVTLKVVGAKLAVKPIKK